MICTLRNLQLVRVFYSIEMPKNILRHIKNNPLFISLIKRSNSIFGENENLFNQEYPKRAFMYNDHQDAQIMDKILEEMMDDMHFYII